MEAHDYKLLLETLKKEKDGRVINVIPPETAVRQLEDVCARHGVDWKSRHAYLIERGGKWRVELSIDGFRTIAARDERYAGQEGPFWTTGPDQPWLDVPPDKKPYASKVGVRIRVGDNVHTTWGVAKYADYATGPMWAKFPSTMVAKCAEMLALRKALPDRLGGLYGAEEMDQSGKAPTVRANSPKFNPSPVDSAQSSTPPDRTPPSSILSFEQRIAKTTALEDLMLLGREIQAAHLGVEEKLALSALYKEKKALLSAGEALQVS